MSFEHLLAHEAQEQPEETTLEAIALYAEALEIKREEKAKLEVELAAVNKEVTKLEQVLLPETMLKLGITSLTLKSGKVVSIKEELSCSVVDYEKLYDFLEEQGDGSLMKTSIEVGKLPQNVLNRVIRDLKEQYDIDGEGRMYIHPSTLKAYFKRLCGVGGDDQAKVPIASLDTEMVNTYTYYKTGIKSGK